MASDSELQTLMRAIVDFDTDTLIHLAERNHAKKDPFSFYDSYRHRGEAELEHTLAKLNNMLLKLMEKSAGNSGKIEWSSKDPKNASEVSKVFQASIDIAMISFQLKFTPSENILKMALLFNGILPEIPNSEDNLKNSICQLCEKLYSVNFVEKCEYFLSNVIIYLLRRTLEIKALKTDVKRLYSLRNVIRTVMSLNQACSVEIWLLLKKCASSALYFSMLEGQRIISLSMTFDSDRVSEVHKILKDQFPSVSLEIASHYGKVYFDAWWHSVKTKNQELKDVFEVTCLQDYILFGIKATSNYQLELVRKLLTQFHCHKKDFAVAKMLYVLYQPLLWPNLKNQNGHMRANACQLFLDVFPLEDPEVNVVHSDQDLNDQLLLIKDLLTDEYPVVRMTAVVGLCVAMSVNWEVFPEEILKTYFRIIVDDLSADSSCDDVRVSVVKGVKVLLENPLTMTTLHMILPKLQGLFHDLSENVRVAFCQLLLRVKSISAIKYFDIVPISHLLARMEDDTNSIKKCISHLIYNSYFPKNEDPKIWVGRCIEIFKSEPAAARVMFTHVYSFIGLDSSVKFMIAAIKSVHFFVKCMTKKSNKKSSPRTSRSKTENIVMVDNSFISLEEAVGFDNLEIVRSLMDCMSIMWLSMKTPINDPDNKGTLKMLVAKIGMPLSDLCLHYKESEIWKSVFYVSSYLPSSIVPSLGSLCFWKLKNLPQDASPPDYMIILECLCNQLQVQELLKLLHEWIAVGFDSNFKPPVKRRKKKGDTTENVYFNDPKPYLGNQILSCMLSHRGMQKIIVLNVAELKNMQNFFDSVKTKIESPDAKSMSGKEASFIKLLMLNLERIAVLLHKEEESLNIQFIDDVACWVEKKIIKYLKSSNFFNPDTFTELIYSLCKNLCEVMADITALGFCDPNSTLYLNICIKLLDSGWSVRFALIVSRFLYKYAVCAQFLYLTEQESVMLRYLMESFCKVADGLSKGHVLDRLDVNDLKETQFVLASTMQIIHNHVSTLGSFVAAAFKSVLRNIITSTIVKSSRIVITMGNESFDEIPLPKQGAFFLSILTQKPTLLVFYIKYFNEYYEEYYKDENRAYEDKIEFWVACCIVLFVVFKKFSNFVKPVIRETECLMKSLEKTLHCIYPQKEKSHEIDSDEKENYLKRETFEKHCHTEFQRLKSLHVSKSKKKL